MTDPIVSRATPLPADLVRRYLSWRETTYAQNADRFRALADKGQSPTAMVISCCDSRIHVTSIFGADEGEFFIHRNVAALVPPFAPNGDYHGTSAAVEFAVTVLKVSKIIVLGHSKCGGVRGCYDMCSGAAPDLLSGSSFVGRWMNILSPAYARLPKADEETRVQHLEKRAVLLSIENLMGFPFVAEAVEGGQMTLHGLWNDIGSGGLEAFDPEAGDFVPVQ